MVQPSTLLAKARIRSAVKADLPYITEIYNYYVSRSTATFATEDERPEERAAWFSSHLNNNLPVIVCILDNRVVGWGSLSLYHQRSAYGRSLEPSIYIHHEYLRFGLGREVLEHLTNSAKERGAHCLVSLVCRENSASLALLSECGFSIVGNLKEVGNKFGRWLDVTILQLLLEE